MRSVSYGRHVVDELETIGHDVRMQSQVFRRDVRQLRRVLDRVGEFPPSLWHLWCRYRLLDAVLSSRLWSINATVLGQYSQAGVSRVVSNVVSSLYNVHILSVSVRADTDDLVVGEHGLSVAVLRRLSRCDRTVEFGRVSTLAMHAELLRMSAIDDYEQVCHDVV